MKVEYLDIPKWMRSTSMFPVLCEECENADHPVDEHWKNYYSGVYTHPQYEPFDRGVGFLFGVVPGIEI